MRRPRSVPWNSESVTQHVADAAGHLAADHDAAVPAFAAQAPDHDVLARLADAPPVLVQAGLDDHAVISGAEERIFDQDVASRVGVHAVVVRSFGHHPHVAHDHVLGVDGVDSPHRAVHDRHAFDEYVLAADRLNEARPQARPRRRTRAVPWGHRWSPSRTSASRRHPVDFFQGHHAAPWPSSLPRPVIATFLQSRA